MSSDALISALYVFALAAFVGYLVISRVPPLLHTPLMSATNAISGISLVGSIVTAGAQHNHRSGLRNDKRRRRICDHRSNVEDV
jgi:NAD/NADP transhydrogenase alpha subunit